MGLLVINGEEEEQVPCQPASQPAMCGGVGCARGMGEVGGGGSVTQ